MKNAEQTKQGKKVCKTTAFQCYQSSKQESLNKISLKIKLEIYKNLENKLEIYSYFKLKNKLEIFELFVNGRWSQY